MKVLIELFKMKIVFLSLISMVIGYGVGHSVEGGFSLWHLLSSIFAVFLLASGSLALNQCQEYKIDALMPRTQGRPLPTGRITMTLALILSLTHVLLGLVLLYYLCPASAYIGLATVFLYNGPYTLYWKPQMAFGAVPGALPGAMPVLIGYSLTHPQFYDATGLYLFAIMFFWQMPHFWLLAIRFREDYARAKIPVLPSAHGDAKTVYYIGLYLMCYVGLAIISPLFLEVRYSYLLLVLPFALKLVWEFYFYSFKKRIWLPLFLWTNFSLLAFQIAPLVDKWWPFLSGQV
jgi:protoheme IX farnesyltransferase